MAERKPEQIDFMGELRRYGNSDPFVPFEIETTSGDRYEVQERLQFALGATAAVLVLPRTGIQVIRMNQISALRVHEPI